MAVTSALRPSAAQRAFKPQATQSPSNAPANPFSRTLASLEPQNQSVEEDRTSAEATVLGNSKASLDVESFKNLLMTGKPTPGSSAQSTPTGPSTTGLLGPQIESSSSTDSSSISRQSLFEQAQETHADSPRTSLDIVESESESDQDMGPVSDVPRERKKPPPAPKHRHGKLVTPRQPQIVSFDSFAASEPLPSPVTRSRENSETTKPLPPVPSTPTQSTHYTTQDTTQPRQLPIPPRQRATSAEGEIPTQQKKIPPPVPLARRQSQLRSSSDGNRSRSNSSLTGSSQHSIEPLSSPISSNADPMLGAKSPPPPPPRSRHGARLTNLGASSANSSNTELPSISGSVREPPRAKSGRSSGLGAENSEPPSPVLGVHRTSSVSSNRNSIRVVSGESTGSNHMPPPPPPPRRRQSNRSSLDQQRPNVSTSSPAESRRTSTEYRRTSTEYRRTSLDSKRRTSVASESSLRREYAPVDSQTLDENALYSPRDERENTLDIPPKSEESRSDSNNILDDMEKFQREIDELRNKYKQVV